MEHCVLSSLILDHEQLSELIHLIRTLSNSVKRLLNGSQQTTCVSFPARSTALGWWLAIVGTVTACPWWHLKSLAELSHQPSSSFIVQGGMAFLASPSACTFLPPRLCQLRFSAVSGADAEWRSLSPYVPGCFYCVRIDMTQTLTQRKSFSQELVTVGIHQPAKGFQPLMNFDEKLMSGQTLRLINACEASFPHPDELKLVRMLKRWSMNNSGPLLIFFNGRLFKHLCQNTRCTLTVRFLMFLFLWPCEEPNPLCFAFSCSKSFQLRTCHMPHASLQSGGTNGTNINKATAAILLVMFLQLPSQNLVSTQGACR